MDTDLQIRSWLGTLRKLRAGVHKKEPDLEKLDTLIQDLELFLEEDKKSKRQIVSLGKRVGNFIFHVVSRYGEHAVVEQIIRWLMK